jgi:hypothetical protein
MATLRTVVLVLDALFFAGSLGLHVVALCGGPVFDRATIVLFPFILANALAFRNLNSIPEDRKPRPSPAIFAVIAIVLATCIWSVVWNFGETGVIRGEPGDRHVHSHGKRLGPLTEEQYQRRLYLKGIGSTSHLTVFGGAMLGMALYSRQLRQPTAA